MCGYSQREEEVKVQDKEEGGREEGERQEQEMSFKNFIKIIYLK